MKNRDKTEINTVKERETVSEGAEYRYELIMKRSKRVASYRLPLYSVRVSMTDKDGKETYAELNDIFSDIGKAIVFFNRIADNLVTPIDLPYIFEDQILV